jgi:hypothetical protein
MDIAKMDVEMPAEMQPQFEAVDANTIKCRLSPPTPEPVERVYDYDALMLQRANLVAEANAIIAEKQKELDYIDAVLTQCQLLGVKSKTDIGGQLPKLG